MKNSIYVTVISMLLISCASNKEVINCQGDQSNNTSLNSIDHSIIMNKYVGDTVKIKMGIEQIFRLFGKPEKVYFDRKEVKDLTKCILNEVFNNACHYSDSTNVQFLEEIEYSSNGKISSSDKNELLIIYNQMNIDNNCIITDKYLVFKYNIAWKYLDEYRISRTLGLSMCD